jgi:S-adenosylmethionine hydrolase
MAAITRWRNARLCGGAALVALQEIKGKVVSISENGQAITNIGIDRLTGVPQDEQVSIACDGHSTSCIFPAEHGQPEMTFLAVRGSSGFLELALVGDDLQAFLGICPGSEVTVRW